MSVHWFFWYTRVHSQGEASPCTVSRIRLLKKISIVLSFFVIPMTTYPGFQFQQLQQWSSGKRNSALELLAGPKPGSESPKAGITSLFRLTASLVSVVSETGTFRSRESKSLNRCVPCEGAATNNNLAHFFLTLIPVQNSVSPLFIPHSKIQKIFLCFSMTPSTLLSPLFNHTEDRSYCSVPCFNEKAQ